MSSQFRNATCTSGVVESDFEVHHVHKQVTITPMEYTLCIKCMHSVTLYNRYKALRLQSAACILQIKYYFR
jgi:hypothetical protein